MGIEPTLPAWKAGTLPLSYTRLLTPSSILDHSKRRDRVPGQGPCLSTGGTRQPRRSNASPPVRLNFSMVKASKILSTQHVDTSADSSLGVINHQPGESADDLCRIYGVGGAGFEPAKAMPPDLQSGPFSHLGIHPVLDRYRANVRSLARASQGPRYSFSKLAPRCDRINRAGGESRTHNRRFTKPVLCQLSYASDATSRL